MTHSRWVPGFLTRSQLEQLTEPINAPTSADGRSRGLKDEQCGGESNTWGLIIIIRGLEEPLLRRRDSKATRSCSRRGVTVVSSEDIRAN